MSRTAVVILNYNGKELLEKFLPSVIGFSGDAQIIVADNQSTDGSRAFLQQAFPGVALIAIPSNLGFCGGYNFALRQVEAEYYVLLNSDVEVTANWLSPIVSLLDNDAATGAVQPKILSYRNKKQFEYAGAAGGFIDWLGYPFCRGRIFDVLEEDQGQYDDTTPIFWASGACMAIRASLYHSMGGLDETFFAHMEEIDLCWRLNRAGHKVMYCGNSTVYHVGGATLHKSNPKKAYYNFRNGMITLIKNLGKAQLAITLPIRLVLDWMAAIRFLLWGIYGRGQGPPICACPPARPGLKTGIRNPIQGPAHLSTANPC
ncbi:MAG TPA: glycosyltransferase family 2 protein [Cyclobacteriaceae bacterium]|nr:glycosyltransferase family 2 protein [Cyclobacteriaceae bacterium]